MSIKINNLTKSFADKTILNDISIDIKQNGIYAIIGRSGSGKSTLINLMSGLDIPTSGEIVLNDETRCATKQQLQKNVSIIYQEYYLMNGLSVYDNIEIAMQLSGLSNVKKSNVIDVLKRLNLDELADRKVEKLSGGEKQRVAIARAYLADKSVIVADEPTGNLDDENAEIVYELLRTIAKDKIVIVVSHDIVFVERYADEIHEILEGKLICLRKAVGGDITAINGDIRTDNKPSLSRGNYVKLLSHIALKRKVLLPIICVVLVIIMTLAGVITSMGMLTYGDIIVNNTAKEMSSMANINYTDDSTIENANVDTSILDEADILYNKGILINPLTLGFEVDYSEEYNNLYYYLFDNTCFNTLIELTDESGVMLSAGSMPDGARQVLVPEYFVQQLIFFEQNYNGKSIKKVDDIVGESMNIHGIEYAISGVHKSDNYYAEQMRMFTVGDRYNQSTSKTFDALRNMAQTAPSLTSLYFGEGFRDDFTAKQASDLEDIIYLIGSENTVINYDDFYNIIAVDISNLSAQSINDISAVEKVFGMYAKQLVVAADKTGEASEFILGFDGLKSTLLIVLIIAIILAVIMIVMMINLQYRDMKKDIGIMMSYGAKLGTISGLFSVLYAMIFALQMILSITLSAVIMPIVDSLFGIAGLSVFTWSAVSVAVVATVSVLSVGLSLLAIIYTLKRKNLTENLRGE